MVVTDDRHHGLSAREQQIMDLHDDGAKPGVIARMLALNTGYVVQIIRTYDFALCWANTTRFERGVRAAEAAYREALAASGGRYA